MTKRPREYRPEDFIDDLEEWLQSGKFLRAWCRQPGKPCFRTVYNWKSDNPDLDARIARARLEGAEAVVEQMVEIGDARDASDPDDVQHRKLRIYAREKALAKMFPKQYGDKVQHDHEGGLTIEVVTGVPEREEHDDE